MAVLGLFMQSHLDDNKNDFDKTLNEWQRYFDITETLQSENDLIVFDFNLTRLM
jgi:hypothetical protein